MYSVKQSMTLYSAVSAAALFAALPAQAIVVPTVTTETSVLGSSPFLNINGDTPVASSNAVASALSSVDRAAAFARADVNFNTTVDASADGFAAATSEARLTETITNTSANTIEYSLAFRINGGGVEILDIDSNANTSDQASAAFGATVEVDTAEIWNISIEAELDDLGFAVTDDNSDDDGELNNFTSFGSPNSINASWSSTNFVVTLGTLGTDESLDWSYFLSADVNAVFTEECAIEDDGYGYGYGDDIDGEGSLSACFFTSVNASDPAGVNGAAFEIRERIIDQPPSVAEPATMAMLGVGLAGMGLARRRRFKK